MARKRKKRTARKTVVVLSAMVLVLALLIGFVSLRKPARIMEPETAEKKAQRKSPDNAFYVLKEACEALPREPMPLPPEPGKDRFEAAPGSLGEILGIDRPDDHPEMLAYLEKSQKCIALVRQSFEKPYYLCPELTDMQMDLPYLARFRQLARVMKANALLLSRQGGHDEEATRLLLDCARFGRLIEDGPLINSLVAVAIQGIATDGFLEVARNATEPDLLKRVITELAPFADYPDSSRVTLECEWRMMDNTNANGGAAAEDKDSNEPWVRKLQAFASAAKRNWEWRKSYHFLVKHRDALLEEAEQSFLAHQEWILQHRELAEAEGRYLFSIHRSIICPRERMRAQYRGALQVLALELYRGEHGQYPEELSDLVPDYLEALPEDPFSGAPFGYRRLEGDDYLLYSVGEDGEDNEGTGVVPEDWVIHRSREMDEKAIEIGHERRRKRRLRARGIKR